MKRGDEVVARVVTISLKDRTSNSKIGLTMRQPYLGKTDWLMEEKKIKEGEEVEEKVKAKKVEKKKIKIDRGKIKEGLKEKG